MRVCDERVPWRSLTAGVVLAVAAVLLLGCGGHSVAWRINHACAAHHRGVWYFRGGRSPNWLVHVRCMDGTYEAVSE